MYISCVKRVDNIAVTSRHRTLLRYGGCRCDWAYFIGYYTAISDYARVSNSYSNKSYYRKNIIPPRCYNGTPGQPAVCAYNVTRDFAINMRARALCE